MSASDDLRQPRPGEIGIDAAQLRPGVYVRLPVPWMEHQFMFGAFVIADDEQVRQIKALNLAQLYCDPTRSRVPPLPKPEVAPPPDPVDRAEQARLAALKAAQMAEKMERAKVMSELRGRLDKAQKHYVSSAQAVGSAFKSFESRPEESVRQVTQVSELSVTALLADPDSAIVLIAEKAQADGNAAHSLSVMTLSLLLGKQARLPSEALCALGIAALLHDIGKFSINSSILRNPARNKHEEAIYQSHCRVGYEVAQRSGRLSPAVLDAILHHHERIDGSGYPDRLADKEIQVAARVVAIANRFDNLANPIDPRRALSPSEALATMWSKEKAAFDTVLLQLFVRAMGVYPPGSIVQLSDGRVGAVVASASTDSPLAPQVMIYAPDVPRRQAIIIDLARDPRLRIERPLRLQERPDDELDYLLPRRKLNWFHSSETQ
ncbi:MAG TPA: HD domain-containing phosphohydrolase [Azonexus sp.]|nr:HD domain-containing phosphohydrolase [Azonexus sp.]